VGREDGRQEPPRVADLNALLSELDALRLTLQTDLTLAAAAVEAGVDQLAGELVDEDLAQLRHFSTRATTHLDALAEAEAGGRADHAADGEADEAVHTEQTHRSVAPLGRRRMLPAAPLVAAAAALLGFLAGVVPDQVVARQAPSMSSATLTSYELSRLASQGAPPEQLRAIAEVLNDELAALVAQAADDPEAAQQALLLIETTTEVLARQGDQGLLREVMAETRALRARLEETLPRTSLRPARLARPEPRPVASVLPRVLDQPEQRRAASSPAPRSSPAVSPRPSPARSTPAPSPTSPAPEPTPQPSEDGGDPLPAPGDLTGS
jgi:hypothetical protein